MENVSEREKLNEEKNLPDLEKSKKHEEKLEHDDHGHEGHTHGIEGRAVLVCGINVTPLALLCALGFHSIFEGIAMGLMKDLNSYINLMIGVVIHHTVASVSLGASL